MNARHASASALAQAAEAINDPGTLEETLDAIVEATRASVPAFDHVGLTVLHGDGTLETKAGTSQLVWELDALQYNHHEGPCVDAIEAEPIVVVANARHEQRWPRYMPAAVQKGLRSQMGVQLFAGGKHPGGLNMYSTQSDEVDLEWVETARLFATHAAIALGHAQTEQQLHDAMHSRKVIGQAIGILMERYQIDENRAFHFLTRASSTANIKLRDVAQELVASTSEKHHVKP